MHLEIERKFLVKEDAYKKEAYKRQHIKQGFLNSDKNRVVRIRIQDDQGFLTIKGKSNQEGTTRLEWEKEISVADAKNLFALCEEGSIEKYRHLVKADDLIYEVDEFLGGNAGLVVAEIELKNEEQKFMKPLWLGKEVTGNAAYYNSSLSKKPFKKWA